jgi:YbbR domain-containing protein
VRLPVARDLHLRIAALLLAIVVWFVAGADIRRNQGDTVEKIVTVGLEVRGVASNLIVTSKPKDVELRIRGARQVVETLDGSKVRAYVSVAGRGEGEHGVRVQTFVPEGVHVIEVVPASTSVTVEAVIGRDMPVSVSLVGFPTEGYVPLQPSSTPRSVTIAGPRSKVEAVTNALAQIDVSGVAAEVSRDVPVLPVDGGGSPVDGVSVYPAAARVTVPVQGRTDLAPSMPAASNAGLGQMSGQGAGEASDRLEQAGEAGSVGAPEPRSGESRLRADLRKIESSR